jgi:hypothetical protein
LVASSPSKTEGGRRPVRPASRPVQTPLAERGALIRGSFARALDDDGRNVRVGAGVEATRQPGRASTISNPTTSSAPKRICAAILRRAAAIPMAARHRRPLGGSMWLRARGCVIERDEIGCAARIAATARVVKPRRPISHD